MANESLHLREQRISESKVRDVFTPSSTIKLETFLVGRDAELRRIVGHLSTPGGHVVIFGDRGVGKSSLANVVAQHFVERFGKENVFRHRCSPRDRFVDILAMPLMATGIQVDTTEISGAHEQSGKAEIGVVVAKADISSKRTSTEKKVPSHVASLPSWVVRTIGTRRALLVIDEVDLLNEQTVVSDLAVLIKHLSDDDSPFKLCLVGVARTVGDLLAGHASALRSLTELKLRRLNDGELREIIQDGANRLSLRFSDEVVSEIVNVSTGYPYFTHLIALKCAEEAISEKRLRIDPSHIHIALKLAAENAESSLRINYFEAINSQQDSLAAQLLQASVRCRENEFNVHEMWKHFQFLFPGRAWDAGVETCLRELIRGESRILQHLKKNVLCFSDPRMPSYISLIQRVAV